MAVSANSKVQANIGPVQNRASVQVDIASTGPNNIAYGDAVAAVLVSTAGVPLTVAQSTDISNTLRSTAVSTQSGTVAGTTTVSVLLAANQSRKALSISNPGPAQLCIDTASSAPTTAAYQAALAAAGGYYEFLQPVYTGAVYGIWASSGSTAFGCNAREFI